jgi:hypothetical protein
MVDIDGEPYVQLDQAGDVPVHGRAHAATSVLQAGQRIAYAKIAPANVPAAWTSWLGKQLLVDGSCHARIDGFALRSGLSGDGVAEKTDEELLDREPALVAHLDGCRGGTTARDAALPAPVAAVVDGNAADRVMLAKLACDDMFASELGGQDRAIYRGRTRTENAADGSAPEMTTVTKIVIHPVTHARYVVVHTQLLGEICSADPSFQLTGVYRVDGPGQLARLYLGDANIDLDQPMLDLMSDGNFELVSATTVTSFQGDALVTRSGDEWWGCPC